MWFRTGNADVNRLILAIVLSIVISIEGASCPCHSPSLCNSVQVGPRKEVVAFSVYRNMWKHYNWAHLTTIVLVEEQLPHVDFDLLCYAHSRKVRVVPLVSFPVHQLTNKSYVKNWIREKVAMLKSTFLDGINLDIEKTIPIFSPEVDALVEFVNVTTQVIHAEIPGSQVTFDASYWPQCTFGHCYKNVAVSQIVDFLLTMNYDEAGILIAGANSPYENTVYSIESYLRHGAKASKLITIQPWYGYDYKCTGSLLDGECVYPPETSVMKTLRSYKQNTKRKAGVTRFKVGLYDNNDSSDKGSIMYGGVEALLVSNKTTGRQWNNETKSPYFNYKDSSGPIHQVWYDDPESLNLKFSYAIKAGVGGIGVWTADFLDYNDFPKGSAAMWKCINSVISGN